MAISHQVLSLGVVVVVVLGFYVPPTAKVIRRRDLGLKSHPKDWRSPGSNSGPLVYKAGSLTARPRRLLVTGGNLINLAAVEKTKRKNMIELQYCTGILQYCTGMSRTEIKTRTPRRSISHLPLVK